MLDAVVLVFLDDIIADLLLVVLAGHRGVNILRSSDLHFQTPGGSEIHELSEIIGKLVGGDDDHVVLVAAMLWLRILHYGLLILHEVI